MRATMIVPRPETNVTAAGYFVANRTRTSARLAVQSNSYGAKRPSCRVGLGNKPAEVSGLGNRYATRWALFALKGMDHGCQDDQA